ncbi:unnamed protein product [Prunus brigantina]
MAQIFRFRPYGRPVDAVESNISAPDTFWMIQIWLQVYFLELRFPDIVLLEDQVMALSLMSAEVPKRSIEEYMMFFRHCIKKRILGSNLDTDYLRRNLSVMLLRDLPFGGGKPLNYHLGEEVYHPNFCARELSCPHLILLKCAVNKINNSANALYPSWERNSCSSVEYDAW